MELDPPVEWEFEVGGVVHHRVRECDFPEVIRWPNEESALAGHDQIVAGLRSSIDVS